MSFYPDEMQRIRDVELLLAGASVQDLGYDQMSLQMSYDVIEIRTIIKAWELKQLVMAIRNR